MEERKQMPSIGIGTYKLKGDVCRTAVRTALGLGYRLVDTASQYANETDVGLGIVDSGVPRGDIFLATKVSPREMKRGYQGVLQACYDSLERLQTPYVDLLMLHWPGIAHMPVHSPKQAPLRREAWLAMEHLLRCGKARRIGVSNYLPRHLDEIVAVAQTEAEGPPTHGSHAAPLGRDASPPSASEGAHASTRVVPYVNQIELHPCCRQEDVVAHCHAHGILVQQYAPVGSSSPAVVQHPVVVAATAAMNGVFSEAGSLLLPEGSAPLSTHDVCLLWGLCAPRSDALVVGSTNPVHMQRLLDLNRLYRDVLAPTVLHRGHALDAAVAKVYAVLGELTEKLAVGGAGDLHTCWFSDKVL